LDNSKIKLLNLHIPFYEFNKWCKKSWKKKKRRERKKEKEKRAGNKQKRKKTEYIKMEMEHSNIINKVHKKKGGHNMYSKVGGGWKE
jgi:hypothetical protein